uniref:Metalloendopeptidase n=1 Tax=Ectomocoris sp. TaxID=3104572 RepID=A0AB38ZEB0_9HEMI
MLGSLYVAVLLATALSLPIKQEEDINEGYQLVCPKDKKGCYVIGHQEISEDKLFEGDVIPFDVGDGGDESRNALINMKRRWPKNTVPYVFHAEFSAKSKELIIKSMRFIESKTCIKFEEFDPELGHTHILFITNDRGCRATTGFERRQKMHLLNLNEAGCINMLRVGKIHHEMLHVLGLKHEHSRPDRDEYVTIVKKNISPEKMHNFIKANPKEYTTYGVPYNYLSVMHYPSVAFSIDNKSPTIVPKNNVDHTLLGQRKKAADSDLEKINIMYKCPKEEN